MSAVTNKIRIEKAGRSDEASPSAVKTLGKALAVLEAVAQCEHPPTVGELAALLGLARPTVHRLVQTLVGAGFLQQNTTDARVSIGFAVLPLASSLLDNNRLRLEALPHLQALAQKMNERVNLGILHRGQVLIIGGTEKPNLPTIYSRFGRSVPLHCCALGKAMLAFMPSEEALTLLEARPMVARTPNTITSIPEMMKELAAIRQRGYSTERGENSPTSSCIGVPLLDRNDFPVGAISVSGRSMEPLEKDVGEALATAELISHLL
ncbi:MAG: IclR family transcriptional regulator [Pigmentiphaga sp.]|uniref:IclR family transcriptional regulator n=1 Tax=Pigmentiphaga sp. TaxID=1977564 RepID=UPI0029B0F300|nr:IclR family transcriptional regulator [Pigmentiphaga sp.]MDX3905922.1 IclR family transcriptional regulator [Pigmentiphaga sp.]